MKLKITFLAAAAMAALLNMPSATMGQTNVGQWDFTQTNLAPTIGSSSLSYLDGQTQAGTKFGTTSTFNISPIDGTNAEVMYFPVSGPSGGYELPTTGLEANGGGSLVNNYTIVMDVLFPPSESQQVRPLVQTDNGIITPDADYVIDTTGGIGAPPGPYTGSVLPNTWYRLAFSVTSDQISKYINGVSVGVQSTGGTDSRFALTPGDEGGYANLFQNSTTNGAAYGYVSSIQVWNDALSAGQIAALGTAMASKIPTNIPAVPSFITDQIPTPDANNVPPITPVSGVLNPGDSVIDGGSISVLLDGQTLAANITDTGTNFIFAANPTNVLVPFSLHTVTVLYSDSVAGQTSNTWTFRVFGYQNVTLPTPIYFESFDEVPEGGIPAGWTVTNWTDSLDAGTNLNDVLSDSYLNWVTISQPRYEMVYPFTDDYISPGFPEVAGNRRQMIPPIVENGEFITNLCSGNLMVAESDQRDGNQVQVMFTKDYDFTGMSNIYVSFHNINEQNQDNICSVEYSVNQGTNWLPLLYMLDDGTTDSDGSDVVTNKATGQIDVFATFNTARSDQAHGLAYGAFIGATVSTNLIPYIRPCRNDDPVQQKRIEVFGLPAAADQAHVRMRFMQAGTGSWYFDIDDLGFYTIPEPILLVQPAPVVADYNGPASFNAQFGGSSLSYQWYFEGTTIPGATNATFTIANAVSNNIGLYTVTASNSYGTVSTAPIPLSLIFTPVLVSSPEELTIAPGDPASFSVIAEGGQPLYYQWLFNSNAIPGATNTSYSIASAVVGNAGVYQVQVSNLFSTVVSAPANLTVYAGPITNDLVVHLAFDGDLSDSSGRANDGTAVGTPTFEPGFLGMAVHTTTSGSPANAPATNNYVTLGYPPDLQFGSDYTGDSTDFSVSFWTKIFHQNDDQSFIGNKDWNSGSNPGWIIDSEGDGMKWNYRDDAVNVTGVGSSRRDSPHVAPQMEDGGWHHVLVTFARHSVGTTYVDGTLVDVTSLAPDAGEIGGSLDTIGLGFNVNIGQDGTGHYTDGGSGSAIDMLVDDLAIWRRVLNRHEALGIFNAGLNSNSVDKATTSSVGAAPIIEVQPVGASGNPGGSVSFYVGVLGTPSLYYQWLFGTNAILSGTNSTLTVTNISASLAGNYTVVISNAYGSVTSHIAALTYLPAPVITGKPVGEVADVGASVTFSAAATGGQPISYWWIHNGVTVAGSSGTNLVLENLKLADAGTYQLVASNSYGSAESTPAVLKVWAGPITSNLVAHLTFDDNLDDSSGRTNNASYAVNGSNPSPTPRFAPGIIGQAFEYTTTSDGSDIEYATFGYPKDLQFDSTNDFSISFWANYTNQSDDLPFIGDKDWSGSGNEGWIITTQSGGNARVNVAGASSSDKYSETDFPAILKNGQWHNLVVSIQHAPPGEAAYVYGYVDGVLYSKHPMTAVGSVDTLGLPFNYSPDNQTNWAVNVGQDGTGTYTDGGSAYDINALIDDLGIWRRALTAHEAAGIYQAGLQGKGLTSAATATLFATYANGTIQFTWSGAAGVELETSTSLNPAVWTAVSGSLGASSASVSVSGGSPTGFYRLVKVQ